MYKIVFLVFVVDIINFFFFFIFFKDFNDFNVCFCIKLGFISFDLLNFLIFEFWIIVLLNIFCNVWYLKDCLYLFIYLLVKEKLEF